MISTTAPHRRSRRHIAAKIELILIIKVPASRSTRFKAGV
jgi:hypothetical protein